MSTFSYGLLAYLVVGLLFGWVGLWALKSKGETHEERRELAAAREPLRGLSLGFIFAVAALMWPVAVVFWIREHMK